MPGRDHKGPEGEGPLTGRGMGECRKNNPTNDERPYGRGRKFAQNQDSERGRGLGKGRRRGFGRNTE